MTGAATMSEQFYAKVARLFPYGISNDTVADASLIRAIIKAAGEICRVGDEALGQRVRIDQSSAIPVDKEVSSTGVPEMDALTSDASLLRYKTMSESADCPLCPKCGARVERTIFDEDVKLFLAEEANRLLAGSSEVAAGLVGLKLEKIAAELFAEGRSDHAKIRRSIKIICGLDDGASKPPGAPFTMDNLDKVRKFMLAQRTGANAPRAAAMEDVISAFKADLVENVVRLVGRTYFTMVNLNMVTTFTLDQPAKADSPRNAWMEDVVPAFKSDLKTNVDRVVGLLKHIGRPGAL